ncbi:MAG TPA: SLC13 family permease [Phycisphaerae bacterium]|nr:SLC13 family permease [Phycisphaerae bacterium]HOJ74514.1 SLC13 family permease [Phycisphaerae bacterium]HOM53246.1 SLC13 family permease [Phycisphaerae bacterium]HOQ86158.1 SLC13 family permease [Phycisphaerae bacterium]HPP28375.1 SLC13 family permease [Phycisphaerae bacterium]
MAWEAWAALGWHAWVTVGVILFVLGMLLFTQYGADLILVTGVTVLVLTGVLDTKQAFAGMANEGMLTVAVLYVVACALDATGATGWVVQHFLRRPKSVRGALVRLMAPVSFMSAWLNNTPVVAMFMPAVNDWGRKNGISSSKLMIPLSYAAVLGGCCTLIGTSTNLIVHGLLLATPDPNRPGEHLPGFNMLDFLWVGLPCTVAGILFMVATHKWLLPDRKPLLSDTADPREYTVEMKVDPHGPLVGKTIEEAGLRHLPRCFLAEINRGDRIIPAVGPQEKLQANDQLVFVGVVDSVVDLRKTRGLLPATDQVFKLTSSRSERCLVEAVVSERCPLVGQTIRDGRFRSVYNAVVIAVARSGQRINRKIGDIVLMPGDTLLLETHPSLVEQQRNSRHFYLVSAVENSQPVRHERGLLALAIMIAMVLVASFEWLSMLEAGMIAAGAMIVTGCCTGTMARRSVDWSVLIAIAASLAIGRALEITGVAAVAATQLTSWASGSPMLSLIAIYGVCLLLTELVTNNAAAVLMFPIALQTAHQLGVNYLPFVLAVAVSASYGFATPLGYQTHLMVYGPGGYRFSDFFKVGLAIDILCWIVAVSVLPLAFPF